MADHNEYLLLVGRPQYLDFDFLPHGRCFVNETPPLQCQIGLPPDRSEWKQLSDTMHKAWGDNPVPHPIEILETRVYLSELLSSTKDNVYVSTISTKE